MWEISIFLLLAGTLPSSTRFFPKDLGEEAGKSIHGGGNKQDKRRGNILGKMGDTGGIIQRGNSVAHYFLLRDLIQLKVFK